MLGIDVLTAELRTLQQRADMYLPPLTTELGNVATAVNNLVDVWKTDGGPTFTQVAMQITALNGHVTRLEQLVERIEKGAKAKGFDVAKLVRKAKDIYDEKVDPGGPE